MLQHRLRIGALLIAALLAGLWADHLADSIPLPSPLASLTKDATLPPGSVFFLVMAPLSCLAALELARILRRKQIAAASRASCSAAVLGLCVSCLISTEANAVHAVAAVSSAAAVVLVGSLVFYSRNRSTEGVVAATGGTLLAFVYLGLMFGFLLAIRREHSVWTVLWVLAVTKSCDIGAYFTGRAIGRHKLIPWLSPGKTVEGLLGGIAVASAIAFTGALSLRFFNIHDAPGPVVGFFSGILFALVGQVGDLLASILKRDAGLKDSGDSLPGFGGLLDVLDSPLAVFPAAFWVLTSAAGADL